MSYSLDGLSNMSSLYFTVVLFVKRRSYYTCIGIVIFFYFGFLILITSYDTMVILRYFDTLLASKGEHLKCIIF